MSSITCKNCGGELEFAPGTHNLKCPYCSFENIIEENDMEIVEHKYNENLDHLEKLAATSDIAIIQCSVCSAQIDFSQTSAHQQCTFCGSDISSNTQIKKMKKSLI